MSRAHAQVDIRVALSAIEEAIRNILHVPNTTRTESAYLALDRARDALRSAMLTLSQKVEEA